MAAIEKFLVTRKRKNKPLAANTAPLEVIHEHPVLVSTLALLLRHCPQLVSERYTMKWMLLYFIVLCIIYIRHEEVVSLLCGSCEGCPLPLVERPHAQFELVGTAVGYFKINNVIIIIRSVC